MPEGTLKVFDRRFGRFAARCAKVAGSPWSFVGSIGLVVGWLAAGPYFKWSDSHSLFVNTVTTVITFLMIFLLQNAQNRQATALSLKMDELIRATATANNRMILLEELEDAEIEAVRARFEQVIKRRTTP